MSADPTMQFPESTQGFNRYAYAGNNPLTNVDPSGFGWFKSLLQVVGFALNFVPGFQGWANMWIRALVSGFLAGGGDLRAGLLSMVTAGIRNWASAGLRSMFAVVSKIGTTIANIAAGILVGVGVAVAMGQKVGAALLGTIRGMASSFAINFVAVKTGIANLVAEATSAGTDKTLAALVDGGGTTANGASAATHKALIETVEKGTKLNKSKMFQVTRDSEGNVTLTVRGTVGAVALDQLGNRIAESEMYVHSRDFVAYVNSNWTTSAEEGGITYRLVVALEAAPPGIKPDFTIGMSNDGIPYGRQGGNEMFATPKCMMSAMAHEFGHVLGLSDRYIKGLAWNPRLDSQSTWFKATMTNLGPQPGFKYDIMYSQGGQISDFTTIGLVRAYSH